MNKMLSGIRSMLKEGGIEIVKLIYDLLRKLKADKTGKLLKLFKLLLRDEVIEKPKPSDSIIRVNRSIPPDYPRWIFRVLYPKLANVGPSEYNVKNIGFLFHPDQYGRRLVGDLIHQYLKKENLLAKCLDLRDLEEIRKMGPAFFFNSFGSNTVYAWKSIAENKDQKLLVPGLCRIGGSIVTVWHWVDGIKFGPNEPALNFLD